MSPVVVVTGANKGIGYEISKKLIADGAKVITTARDQSRLDKAASELKPFGSVKLDVTSDDSVEQAKQEIKRLSPSIDALVNNAGFAYHGNAFGYDEAKLTMSINYYGTKRVTKAFYPLLSDHGRIVNVCSFVGRLSKVSEPLQKRFSDPNATEESIDNLVEEFLTGVKEGDYKKRGFSDSMYGMSKLALIALTKVLAREAMADSRKILVTGCCPGWCQTDMSSHSGPRSAETGAQVMAWLAAEVDYDPTMSGKLYRDDQEFDWQTGNLLSTGQMY
ncbi:hypothetical protein FOZ60_008828 [Perkinsus olseni]|uniref:Carbonyl reductase [NADPH] 1 n=1 Tax=Perkinsus olseni TaxID=32597 RepID=A0A7J6NIE1_PEROL|nr:hypothetical protein FOZ60_008828 [Perkinsus olseni]